MSCFQLPSPVNEGDLLWEPSSEYSEQSNITKFIRWLKVNRNLCFSDYHQLWEWSVTDIESFWGAIWDFFDITGTPYKKVLTNTPMPETKWFPGAYLNYAERSLNRDDDKIAVIHQSEVRGMSSITYKDLRQQVSGAADMLRSLGVRKGDRVVAYMPNIPETIIAFLASASIGAIWSSCSPEFGTRSVVDRFRQINPKILLAVDGYRYGGKDFDRMEILSTIQKELTTLQNTILIPYLDQNASTSFLDNTIHWSTANSSKLNLTFEQVEFDHPLWILYSSGTTGLPKPIVHGHGGIMLEHIKSLALHLDIKPEDRFFWFTTTGWMMWNLLIGGLLQQATIILYDGDPSYPNMNTLWNLAQDSKMTYFGASAPLINTYMKEKLQPKLEFDLSRLKGVGSTGAPLQPEGFEWVYRDVKRNVHLGSYSGGTDMCTGFLGPSPILPVHAGEIQCRTLGARVESYDPDGQSLVNQVGELVITEPLPSMPIYFWDDLQFSRYTESYFSTYRGIWRHGDWIKITDRHSCVISGRSDSTLNRGGIRMGTSEFYSVVEEFNEVMDSLVVDTSNIDNQGLLLLFLKLRDGYHLDDDLENRISAKLRSELSPRHIPNRIYAVPEIPKTLNGKKMEIPVKRLISGVPLEDAISIGSVATPSSLDFFINLSKLNP